MRNGKRYQAYNHDKKRGFAYLSVLIIVAVMSIMAFKLSGDLSVRLAREKEADLLFNGDQIASAILSYYESGPVRGCYPPNLNVLLEDRRDFHVMRHLRKIFIDPMWSSATAKAGSDSAGSAESVAPIKITDIADGGWEIVKNESDRIIGVHSKSTQQPFKQRNFPNGRKDFEGKTQYAEWIFTVKKSTVKPASPAVCAQESR
ncbi:type II secretion system protein [Glaciimonas immobilis]|uniref:Type II secretion system protein n=1 Tax=Glaciimonas immobilis TaxID=728004 RepID=A0A840RZY1_9BURK|nr:type II secretion system protein [Glaciimonas immobilis]KAF3998294.1 type II secretion system protein [Glaciimonas immobilis]MBB5201909.1 hypothetical protein [Glaciimonas immobilis]